MSDMIFCNVSVFVPVIKKTLIGAFVTAAAWEKSAQTTHTAAPIPMSGKMPA